MKELSIVLAESSIELVPAEICDHPAIRRHAERRGKKPREMLLDRSYHHHAMLGLKNAKKRGRPDIAHFCLLIAFGSLLNKEGMMKMYVHTFDDHVMEFSSEIRLPRNYNRFVGLIEQLFKLGRVPLEGKPLIVLKKESLPQLLREINPTKIVIFTSSGKPTLLKELVKDLCKEERPAIIIGGFARGEFREETLRLAHERISIDPEPLEAWTVISKVIHEFENALGISEKRLTRLN